MLRNVDRFDLILGNHDVYHKNTNSVNGPTELYQGFLGDGFRIHDAPQEVKLLDDTEVLFLPWINPENHDASMRAIAGSRSPICMGHLEMEGFEIGKGIISLEGLNPALFSKFDVTCSGHFHRKQSRNGIHYLGSHSQFNWGDWNDERGFHIFDTETRELEFIPNPYTMFEKVYYADDVLTGVGAPEDVAGKHVKVIVSQRNDQIKFEQFISSLEQDNPASITIVEDHLNADLVVEQMEEVDETEDTLTIFRKALASSESGFQDEELDELITGLYNEASSIAE